MPLIPALGRQRQAGSMNEASIIYSASPGQARLQRNSLQKKKKKTRETEGEKEKGRER